jgi:hypothetical protein
MTDAEREIIEAIFGAMEQMLRLLRTVLHVTQTGMPLDVARIEAKATALAAQTWQAEARLLGLRPDGTDPPPETIH